MKWKKITAHNCFYRIWYLYVIFTWTYKKCQRFCSFRAKEPTLTGVKSYFLLETFHSITNILGIKENESKYVEFWYVACSVYLVGCRLFIAMYLNVYVSNAIYHWFYYNDFFILGWKNRKMRRVINRIWSRDNNLIFATIL